MPGETQAANGVAALAAAVIENTGKAVKYALKKRNLGASRKHLNSMQEINVIYTRHLADVCLNIGMRHEVKINPPFVITSEEMKADDEATQTNKIQQSGKNVKHVNEKDHDEYSFFYDTYIMSDQLRTECANLKISDKLPLAMQEVLTRIRNSINNLLAYDTARGERSSLQKDITGNVISYLLTQLRDNCAHFTGTLEEADYIERINRFIKGFINIKKKEKKSSKREKYMTEVETELHAAGINLKKFCRTHSHVKLNNSLLAESDNFIEKMLKLNAKLITAQGHWDKINNTIPARLAKREIATEHRAGIRNATTVYKLPDNLIYSDWIARLADDYLIVTNQKKLQPGHQFVISKKKFIHKKYHDYEESRDLKTLKELRAFFDKSIFTNQYNNKKTEKLVEIHRKRLSVYETNQVNSPQDQLPTDNEVTTQQKIHNFNVNHLMHYVYVKLIDYMIYMSYFARHLASVKEHLANPDISNLVFTVCNGIRKQTRDMGEHLKAHVERTLDKVGAGYDDNHSSVLYETRNLINQFLTDENGPIRIASKMMNEYTANFSGAKRKKYIDFSKYPSLRVFLRLAQHLEIKVPYSEEMMRPTETSNTNERSDSTSSLSMSGLTPVSGDPTPTPSEHSASEGETESPPAYSTTSRTNRKLLEAINLAANKLAATPPKNDEKAYQSKETELINCLQSIMKESKPNQYEHSVYLSLQQGLAKLRLHANEIRLSKDDTIEILNDKTQKKEEYSKGAELLHFVDRLENRFYQHLNRPPKISAEGTRIRTAQEERRSQFRSFCNLIESEFTQNNLTNHIIDAHRKTAIGLVIKEILLSILTLGTYYLAKKSTLFGNTSTRQIVLNTNKDIQKNKTLALDPPKKFKHQH